MENAADKCVEPGIWHAYAEQMVQIPPVNSKVYYFPQGHAENAQRGRGGVDFGDQPVPWSIPCRVDSVKLMAAQETDEVYAKIRMTPLKPGEKASDDGGLGLGTNAVDEQAKTTSFVKTLTRLGVKKAFSSPVPRHHAVTVFPALDYSADRPAQTVHAEDVRGVTWQFRHIYSERYRRHQLTKGWRAFIKEKKLVAGDSIVFIRIGDGTGVRVGIRRGRASPEAAAVAVVEAATLAASGRPFEVVYYPGAGTPEFCVNAATVDAALQVPWRPGARIKMSCAARDSSRTVSTSYKGTVSACHNTDPIRWPDSQWRRLQVKWDRDVPSLLAKVKCVSPWLVELVPDMSSVHTPSPSVSLIGANGNPATLDNVSDEKPRQIMLFGKQYQVNNEATPQANNVSVNENLEKPNVSDGSGSAHNE